MFILAIAEWRRGEGLTTSLPWVRAPEIVILFGLPGRTAQQIEKVSLFYKLCANWVVDTSQRESG